MMNLLKKIDLHKKRESLKSDLKKRNDLIEEIKSICNQMDKTNIWFQMESDSDLIEACIHQREVLNARYRYLINKIKLDKIS